MKKWLTHGLGILLVAGHSITLADSGNATIDDIRKAAEALMQGKPSVAPDEGAAESATPEPPIPPEAVSPPTTDTAAAPSEAETSIRVEENDSLSAIAQRLYGDSAKYTLIYEANRERLKLDSPDRIPQGAVLVVPPLPVAGEPATQPERQ